MNLLLKSFLRGPALVLGALGVFIGCVVGVSKCVDYFGPKATMLGLVIVPVLMLLIFSWVSAYEDASLKPGEKRGLWD